MPLYVISERKTLGRMTYSSFIFHRRKVVNANIDISSSPPVGGHDCFLSDHQNLCVVNLCDEHVFVSLMKLSFGERDLLRK